MGHYKKYSGGNYHLSTDMDHERRLIHDAKEAIWDEDRKSAAHADGVSVDTKSTDQLSGDALEQTDHLPEEDYNK